MTWKLMMMMMIILSWNRNTMIFSDTTVNYHFPVMRSSHEALPLRENRKGKWRQAKSTTTR